jgi:hypothetical protein
VYDCSIQSRGQTSDPDDGGGGSMSRRSDMHEAVVRVLENGCKRVDRCFIRISRDIDGAGTYEINSERLKKMWQPIRPRCDQSELARG